MPTRTIEEQLVSTCIGCGCTDLHACANAFDEPCHWLEVEGDRGVCSECPTHLRRFRAGDRSLSKTQGKRGAKV